MLGQLPSACKNALILFRAIPILILLLIITERSPAQIMYQNVTNKKIALGSGWAEAPRGALGHWITIDKKRIANYQCVVPSTWNHSPMDDNSNYGAAEQTLVGDTISLANTDSTIVDILRYLHPYDFCIACAVHVVKPDGSTIAKFKMETDGKVTKFPHDAEI